MKKKTVFEKDTEDIANYIDEFLEDTERADFRITSISVEELNLDNSLTYIKYSFILDGKKHENKEASGLGIVDAMIKSLISELSHDYRSIANFSLDSFTCEAKLDNKKGLDSIQSDAPVEVKVGVCNSLGGQAWMSAHDNSLIRSCIKVIEKLFSFLMDTENLFVKCKRIVETINSPSIKDKYVNILSNIVKIGNYAKLKEKS